MITVGEVMTNRLITLKQGSNVYDARLLMQEHNIRHIPILDDSAKVVGLVSQRDVLSASESTLHQTSDESRISLEKQHKLGEIMAKNVCHVDERESLRAAAVHMRKHKHGCLLVESEGVLKGIITDTDFVGVAINLMEQIDLSEEVLTDNYVVDDEPPFDPELEGLDLEEII